MNGSTIVKMSQRALLPPEMSSRRKMSNQTVKRSQNHTIQMKNMNIDQKKSRNV